MRAPGGPGLPALGQAVSERLAAAFDLGAVSQPLRRAADGWGGHNQVFRLETDTGTWAVKRHGRPGTPPPGSAAVDIEAAAYAGGVPMPRPVGGWIEADGVWFRCHEWVDGTAKLNEDTTADEASAMGRIVAHLHGLAIEAVTVEPPDPPDVGALERAGKARGARWAAKLAGARAAIDVIAGQPGPNQLGGDELVGSHRDLNAHNVLFSTAGLRLVDWDGAGPAPPRWERADFAVRWADRHDRSCDETVLEAFLRGYLDGGGELDADDPSVLTAAPAALLPWVVQNVEMAVSRPTEQQDELAAVMIEALLDVAARVPARQAVLARCLRRVLVSGC